MKNKPLHISMVSILILCMIAINSAPATAQTSDKFPTAFSTFRFVAKRGDNLSFLRASIYPLAFQWVFVFTVNRNLGRDIRNSNFKRWLRNITTLPRIPDGDHWVTNYIGHPLLGASVFAFYRNRGFSNEVSLAGTFLQSTLFEYTVEGWKKPPSGVDLIVTPVVGSLIGSQVGMNSFILSSSYAISKYIFRLF